MVGASASSVSMRHPELSKRMSGFGIAMKEPEWLRLGREAALRPVRPQQSISHIDTKLMDRDLNPGPLRYGGHPFNYTRMSPNVIHIPKCRDVTMLTIRMAYCLSCDPEGLDFSTPSP